MQFRAQPELVAAVNPTVCCDQAGPRKPTKFTEEFLAFPWQHTTLPTTLRSPRCTAHCCENDWQKSKRAIHFYHSSEEHSYTWREKAWRGSHILSAVRKQRSKVFSWPSPSPVQVETLIYPPFTVKPLWKHPHRHTQRCVSQVIPNPVRWEQRWTVKSTFSARLDLG